MDDYNERIIRLLQLYMLGEITEEEQRELETWCAGKEEYRRFFDRVREDKRFADEFPVYRGIDERRANARFKVRVGCPGVTLPKKRKSWMIIGAWKYAAVLVVGLLVGGLWLWSDREGLPVDVACVAEGIRPGCPRATLVLDDGKRVVLAEKGSDRIAVEAGLTATREEGGLVYAMPAGKSEGQVKFNELLVPRGGEYKVTLADGTRVQLNSATTLRYPVVFNGEERKVYLAGEAYFVVAKDAGHPFLVDVGGVEIKVYGTSFNINTFRSGGIQTVLVEGSVSVRVVSSGEERVMKPGQLARVDKDRAKVEIKEVDVSLYTGWKEGIFRFEDERLEDILATLSNWYNVDFFYQVSSVKELHFSGFMERYEEIGMILDAITISTGVKFIIQGRTITVSK